MNRKMRVARCFLLMGVLLLGLMLGMTCKKKNQPPGAPSIPSGPASGRKDDTLRFSTVAEDPDGDSVAVRFDWGDSAMSDWSPLVADGDSVAMTHAWQKLAAYSIRAQGRDKADTVSAWSDVHQLAIASFIETFGGDGWDRGNAVLQTPDGGYVVAGITESFGAQGSDVGLIRTDGTGNLVWLRTIGGSGGDGAYSLWRTFDGGYVMAGATSSYGAGGSDCFLLRTDSSGNEVWHKTFGGSGQEEAYSVQQTSDGGYVLVGFTQGSVSWTSHVYLVKTDAFGDSTWSKTLGDNSGSCGCTVRQTTDGGYVIVGNIGYADTLHMYLVKTDASGNKLWDRSLGGTERSGGQCVQQTTDGGYILVGTTQLDNGELQAVLLIKTDSLGNSAWSQTFGGGVENVGYWVQQTTDGGYVITGEVDSLGAGSAGVWLIKTDASGNRLWSRTPSGDEWDRGRCVQQTADGGYVVAGDMGHGSGDLGNICLIKTDADGN
jgi:hypothetical protein